MNRPDNRLRAVAAFLHPVLSIWGNAVALVKTIGNAKVLVDGRWAEYLNFRPAQAINMLFYWTQAVNLRRYGRSGISPVVGGGRWKLGQWWHITLISNYAFYVMGIVLPIAAMSAWWLSHLIWLETTTPGQVLLVMSIVLLSSMFFAQTFIVQNYNAAGWALLPMAIWGLFTGHPAIAGICWILMSFLSITSILVGCALSCGWAIESNSVIPLTLIAPAAMKVAMQIAATQRTEGKDAILSLLKAIGVTRSEVKYKRIRAPFWSRDFTYLLALVLIFTAACWSTTALGRWVALAALACFVLNEKIARFADIESMQAMLLSVGTAVTLASRDPWLLLPLWLMVNPIPATLSITSTAGNPLRLPVASPFPIGALLDRVGDFFELVAIGKRVIFAHPDPEGDYNRVFGGYRIIVEAAAHVASLREFHVLPDWHFVFEHNHPDSPDCWAMTPEEIGAKASEWDADYVVVTRRAGEAAPADAEFDTQGLRYANSQLDWADVIDVSVDTAWWNEPTPTWRLYKVMLRT